MKTILSLLITCIAALYTTAWAEKPLSEKDLGNLHVAIEVMRHAVEKGQPPFSAAIAGPDGTILMTQENMALKLHDHTQHAESALASKFCRKYYNDPDFREKSTLYTSVEPCAMCMFTMFSAGIGRVVYALSEKRAYQFANRYGNWPRINLSSRAAASYMSTPMVVEGPYLEQEAAALFEQAFEMYVARKDELEKKTAQ